MTHILQKLRDDVAKYPGEYIRVKDMLYSLDTILAAQPEPDELVAYWKKQAKNADEYPAPLAAQRMRETADLITSQQAENAALLAAKEAAEAHAEAGWDQQRHWSARYDEALKEIQRLRAGRGAGWLAGRDAAADRVEREGHSLAHELRYITPPADDAAALEALIAQARAEGRREGAGWQPMDTAPKDGARILAADGKYTQIMWWNNEGWTDALREDFGGEYNDPDGWMQIPAGPIPDKKRNT